MTYRELAEASIAWVLSQVREDDGPYLADAPGSDRDSLYAGIAGLAPLLAEVRLSRDWSAEEQGLAERIVERLLRQDVVEASLYDGLAGFATALRMLAPGTEAPVLRRLQQRRTPEGWRTTWDFEGAEFVTDVVGGSTGILMTQLWVGEAVDVQVLLDSAEPTRCGLDWRMFPGYRSSSPNFSHGTAGVCSLLALTGHLDAAVAGAEHLLCVGTLDVNGFAVPHTIPDSTRDVERFTWGWCHGPAGTSQLFAALARAGVPEVGGHDVTWLRRRCFDAVLASGVPARLRPGFWDNDGRCCGTAGVGDLLLDAAQDLGDEELLAAAAAMADALVERAVEGSRWRFVEHRAAEPLLPPATGWMQGAAGIAAFLLRLARVQEQGLGAPVVDRPDEWWAVPPELRLLGSPA